MPRGSVHRDRGSPGWREAPISKPAKAKQNSDHGRPRRAAPPRLAARGTIADRREARRRSDATRTPRRPTISRPTGTQVPIAAEVLEPAARLEALDADADGEHEEAEDEDRREEAAVAEPGSEVAEHRRGVGRREEQQRREVEQVVDPQAPAAPRAGEGPEGAMHPGVDAALVGMLLRQDRDGERPAARRTPARPAPRAAPTARRRARRVKSSAGR